jgi:alkylhydroperoxidase family enzyme
MMSTIHEQAMTYVYQQVLQRLIGHFAREERTALQLLVQRIVVAAGGMEQVGDYKVLVAHGGGKVSSYTLALLRAAQLTIAGRAPRTFHLRVATLRHAGMTESMLEDLNQGYGRLFLHDDPRVELLMVETRK